MARHSCCAANRPCALAQPAPYLQNQQPSLHGLLLPLNQRVQTGRVEANAAVHVDGKIDGGSGAHPWHAKVERVVLRAAVGAHHTAGTANAVVQHKRFHVGAATISVHRVKPRRDAVVARFWRGKTKHRALAAAAGMQHDCTRDEGKLRPANRKCQRAVGLVLRDRWQVAWPSRPEPLNV